MEEEELDLLDLLLNFWNKKILIIFAAIIGVVAGFVYTKYFVTPLYSSSVTLILAKSTENTISTTIEDGDRMITQADINLNQKLISTYEEIMKSKRVANKVIDNLKLDLKYEDFKKGVTVNAVEDTDVIKFSIKTVSPELSMKIANEMYNVFAEEVDRIYSIKNVAIIDSAEENTNPINVDYKKTMAIFGIVAVFIVCLIIFMFYYFDNTIKSSEDVKKLTDFPVLTTIPKVDSRKTKGGK